MRKFLLTAVFALIAACVFAQERIAVFPFEILDNAVTRNDSILLYQAFSNEFKNRSSSGSAVVPRQDVDRLINTEMDFQLSVFSAQEKTAEMMRVQNATRILSGTIGKMGNSIIIIVSLYTYPELNQLPGGAQLRVNSAVELFDKIPELVRIMQNEIAANQNPIIGRWRSTISSNGQTLICILYFNNNGSIDVEQYDTNRVTQQAGGMRYTNDIRSGTGSGSYSIRRNGNAVVADISLTISGVSHEFTAITTQANFNISNPNQFTVNPMQCEFYVTTGRIRDSYRTFIKM